MREFTVTQEFDGPPAEMFASAFDDALLETKFLSLCHSNNNSGDIVVPEWTSDENKSNRVITFKVIPSEVPFLSPMTKLPEISVRKFQEIEKRFDSNEFVIDSSIFFNQTQAVISTKFILSPIYSNSSEKTKCTITVKNNFKNLLMRDKLELLMEIETKKQINLWLELFGENYILYKLKKQQESILSMNTIVVNNESTHPSFPVTSIDTQSTDIPTPSTSSLLKPDDERSILPFSRSSHDMQQEAGELEEIRSLSNGILHMSKELDNLRQTVENHYLRICSVEHSIKKSGSGPHDSTSVSVREMETHQKELRSLIIAQMQAIEKAFLKQQQQSQQVKMLETRWENALDKIGKRLQQIDTLRYGIFGSWRQALTMVGFIIIWPLIVRYLWLLFGKRLWRVFIRRYFMGRSIVPNTTSKQTGLINTLKETTSTLSTAQTTNPLVNRLSQRNFWS